MVSEGGADDCSRGQAETIGVILIFGLVLTGAVVVVSFGSSAINDTQDQVSEDRAEQAMTQFDSKAALVALGNSDTQEVDFGTDRQSNYEVDDGEGWIRITVENQSSGGTDTIVNETMGTVTYEVNDNTIAYQGGGVWKRVQANESRMVSPPEFYFRNGTLTLPIVNVTGAQSLGSEASITHEETIQKYPNASARNPVDNRLAKVTVKSQYYKGWGRYFEERTDGEVQYDHDRNTVTLTLISPLETTRLENAATALTASDTFTLNGRAKVDCGSDVYTNSYNSSKGAYCGNPEIDNEGDIVYAHEIDISVGTGTSNLRGDIKSGGKVIVDGSMGGGQPEVEGNINYTDDCEAQGGPPGTDCSDRIDPPSAGSVNNISGVSTNENTLNAFIDIKAEEIDSSAGNISGDRLDFGAAGPSDTVELTSGSYYLERIDLDSDEELVLDTDGGVVTLVVEGDIRLKGSGSGGGTITVEDQGKVQVYVKGNNSVTPYSPGNEKELNMRKNSEINIDNDTASRFRVYGKDNFTAKIGEGNNNLAKYVGVIYAPPGKTGNGRVDINGGEVYGAILTGNTTVDKGSIHYDVMLGETSTLSDIKVLKITYLHVSVNRVRVD